MGDIDLHLQGHLSVWPRGYAPLSCIFGFSMPIEALFTVLKLTASICTWRYRRCPLAFIGFQAIPDTMFLLVCWH